MSTMTNAPKLGFGLFLVVLGAFLLLEQLDMADFGDLVYIWWPSVFVYFGIQRFYLFQGLRDWLGWILTILGLVLIIDHAGYLPFDAGDLLFPAAIIAAGIWVLTKSGSGKTKPEPTSDAGTETVSISAFMSGSDKTVTTHFRGGTVNVLMGGVKTDLRGAELVSGSVLDISVIMGGIELFLPPDWTIELRSQVFLGGIEDNRRLVAPPNPDKLLVITGTVVMGGLEVRS